MNYKSVKYIIIVFISILTACNSDFFKGKLDEGTILYEIKYLDDAKSNPLISLLPTEMTIKFKEDSYIQKIEGWMGIFSMAGIYNKKAGTNSALLKIMSDKYHYETTLDGVSFGYDSLPEMKIEYSDEIKEIAGYKCKKAIVNFTDNAIPDIELFYTNEIMIGKPNNHNPFGEIDGVLLKYQMGFQKFKMEVTAVKVEQIDIADEEFDIPSDYEKVSIDRMQEVLDNLM
ncbi:MAG TPA: hypothetical protein DDX39_03270 [Bacteroidales bacterium]|nr:MAG: hypothetical protein A2W98_02615 [Bacteroidetes bacterium GWF2_33_38]HBF87640.1 hypothetical protein [Bacteroidales bacterium]